MPSIIEVDTIKNKTGTQNTVLSTDGSGNNTLNAGVIKSNTGSNTGLTIGSDGQVTVNQNNPTITLGSNASMASSGLTVRNITQVSLGDDQTLVSSTAKTTFFSPTYNPKFSGSKVQGWLTIVVSCNASVGEDGRKDLDLEFTGSNITDVTWGLTESNTIGTVGRTTVYPTTIIGPLITTTGTGTITCNCKLANTVNDSSIYWYVYGDGTARETNMTWVEYK